MKFPVCRFKHLQYSTRPIFFFTLTSVLFFFLEYGDRNGDRSGGKVVHIYKLSLSKSTMNISNNNINIKETLLLSSYEEDQMHHLGSRIYKTHWFMVDPTLIQQAQSMRKDPEGLEINTEKIKHFLCRRIKMHGNTITKDRVKTF